MIGELRETILEELQSMQTMYGEISNAFKDFKWFNSHNVGTDVQCGICRLEMPVDLKVDSDEVPDDVFITAQILCNQIPVHESPVTTHFSLVDEYKNALVWDHALSFPVKIRDLSLDAVMVITAWKSDGKTPFGGTTMRFFDDAGCLKHGKQKLIFYFGCTGDPNVLIHDNTTPGNLYDLYAQWDHGFQMEKNLEAYRASVLGAEMQSRAGKGDDRVQWLDRLALNRIQSILEDSLSREYPPTSPGPDLAPSQLYSPMSNAWGRPPEELDLMTYCCLVVEMPVFAHTVLHEQKVYNSSVVPHFPPFEKAEMTSSCMSEDGGVLEFSLNGRQFSPNSLTIVADWDMEEPNLTEGQYRSLAHDMLRGASDPGIKPNLQEKERIEEIVAQALNTQIKDEDMDLLYKFRYFLTENKRALIKFLSCVQWRVESEVEELPTLLALWRERAPIDVADALKLLGREEAFKHPYVRQYAVDTLETASDEDLLMYLLQLVQALRYEPNNTAGKSATSSGPSAKSLRAGPSNGTWQSGVGDGSGGSGKASLSPLADFLIRRACRSLAVANSLYWYLKVETEDKVDSQVFENVLRTFLESINAQAGEGSQSESSEMGTQITALDEYISKIVRCIRDAKATPGTKAGPKQDCLRKLLSERGMGSLPKSLARLPMPLNPAVKLIGLVPTSARMFSSAVYPGVISFKIQVDGDDGDASEDKVESLVEEPIVKLIFKCGDDMRQDQLVMQLLLLMDGLLRKVGLDLKLLTYRILAISQDDGIMEFVDESEPVSKILYDHKSIANFLRKYNPDKSGPYEMSEEAMDNFVKSCAVSCVVTFILGIGDRHLDNIMITRKGQLFHLDFGWIFGQDPKPLPPPFRFTREMADAMGGEDSRYYAQFKAYCCQAYIWLRRSANLILNLLSLMGDAGIEHISQRSDLATVLYRTAEKFRLELTDEQAEQYFLGLINESLTSIAPRVMEVLHRIAVARR